MQAHNHKVQMPMSHQEVMTFKSRGEVFQRELKPVSDAGMDDLNILFLQNPCLPPVHLHRLHRRGQQKILQSVSLPHKEKSLMGTVKWMEMYCNSPLQETLLRNDCVKSDPQNERRQ